MLTIICRGNITAPIRFGLDQLEQAVKAQKIEFQYEPFWNKGGETLLVGLTSNRFIQMVLERDGIVVENKPEGLLLARCSTDRKTDMAVALGTDERGLMYALCELAERVEERGLSALQLEKELEYPAISVRVAGRFLYGERDDGWYFSDEFWDYYTARLAVNRVNRLQLVTGFDTAYMSPPYPFLIKTAGYEEVTAMVGSDPEARRIKCLEQLRKIGRACRQKGIDFCFGSWQQRPWTTNQKSMVQNCPTGENFLDYAQKSIAQLLMECPEIDGLSLRVNPEAGIRAEEGHFKTAQDFWYVMFDAIKSTGRQIFLDLRAKGLTDSMIEYAYTTGLDITVPTKAWCEHIGQPYQMLQLRQEEMVRKDNENSSRRYSYDNMQRSPRSYDLQYRIWNYGSTNLLLWGEPYHVSRFIKSCLSGQATGFEFTAPLSMRGGHALIPGDAWPLHVHEDMKTYKFEDERYWMWYRTFGRMSFNPGASSDVWRREMRKRFGEAAPDMEMAYISSSRILPLITTAHFPEHPSMHYWPELYGSAALFAENNYEPYFTKAMSPRKKDSDYANSDPSDETLFCSIEDFVKGELAGQPVRYYSPLAIADCYYALAQNTMEAVNKLQPANGNPEIKASLVDFTMLACLGYYHAHMVHAAYHLSKYRQTGDKNSLGPAYEAMKQAHDNFAKLSSLGTKYYARNLMFDAGTSVKRNGNWQDRLENQVDKDLAALEKILKENGIEAKAPEAPTYRSLQTASALAISFADNVPATWQAGNPLDIVLRPGFTQGLACGKAPVVHYRNVNMREGEFRQLPMTRVGETYTATIPGDYLTAEYNLNVYFTCEDSYGNMLLHPGIFHACHNEPVYTVRITE